ncbi:hypothetical protein H696_02964 [Fonticula alba]|uniref:DUF866 domain-containing protein n=1 Tax=Fonticula alba TaxID=691883 RepID=A0A058Z936_FONAL|nr:hypothetical protein H696_02964 [Fonticula alba]KCV70606.1 hypothetical protein H696_02964 [Fonticula alba]|eukprot:XP_009495122.1 hypothetical protein H696_02964 [Fonticula alba]
MIQTLLISALIENGQNLRIPNDYTWKFTLECSNCRERSPKPVVFNGIDKDSPGDNDRVSVNFYMTCKGCRRQATIDVLRINITEITGTSPELVPFATFECRNTSLVEFFPSDEFEITSTESDTIFKEVDPSDEWADYDEKGQVSVSIEEFNYKLD